MQSLLGAGHRVALLAAKDQSVDNHALVSGLIAGLIFGGVLAVIGGISGAVDPEYTGKTIFVGAMLIGVGVLVYKVTHP